MIQGFDSDTYLKEQSKYILERVNNYDKLYLEFGGKLLGDFHAARVLPGYDPDAKIRLLQNLKDDLEIIICVYAEDIERNKLRGDLGITYEMDVMRLIDDLHAYDLNVNSVVMTRYHGQPAASLFIDRLKKRNIKVYEHAATKGYPLDVNVIVSEEGYGQNPYIETTKPIVVVTAPGPNSGKMATCLSQLYHEWIRGKKAGYSKFETFPVWNVPLKHPLNLAYEAATADLQDVNMIDPFHLEAYGEMAVNYNRDIEAFPVLKRIIEKITGEPSLYRSPTDMGVNRLTCGIIDEEVVIEASKQEVIRRYLRTACDYKRGYADYDTFERELLLMEELNLTEKDRIVVQPAHDAAEEMRRRDAAKKTDADAGEEHPYTAEALELPDGRIVTGKESKLMTAPAAVIMNAIKVLAGVSDEIHLISPLILQPLINLKKDVMQSRHPTLSAEEVILALSICAVTNPMAQACIDKLKDLKGSKSHATTMISQADESFFVTLGIDSTSEPVYASRNLYYN